MVAPNGGGWLAAVPRGTHLCVDAAALLDDPEVVAAPAALGQEGRAVPAPCLGHALAVNPQLAPATSHRIPYQVRKLCVPKRQSERGAARRQPPARAAGSFGPTAKQLPSAVSGGQ